MELLIGLILGCVVGAAFMSRWRPGTRIDEVAPVSASSVDPEPSDAVRSSLRAIELGILVFDSQGREIYRNPAGQFARLTRPMQAVIDGEIRDLVASMRDFAVKEPAEREIELYGPPKSVLLARALPSMVDDALGFVVVVDDVTNERRIEEVRRSFVSNVSHELRTPVGAIAVLAETMASTDDPVVIARLSDRLSNAAHRLGDMIEDLLELSRTESGEEVEAEQFPIAHIISDAVSNLTEPAKGAGVDVTTTVTPLDLLVAGDRRQLRSAVQNLLDNAIKYSEPGGEIRVTAQVRGQWISIAVADQGIGIPESDLDRIFERFYRVDAARRRETGGTGLGLSIVRHVAINHGGDVSAFSIEGEGTTFTIELPVVADIDPTSETVGDTAVVTSA